MNYYISDLHLFHESIIKYDNRPFESLDEMHRTILTNWNSVVTNGDIVYILGDISLRGKNEELIALVAQLKGRKVLIKGNHDDISDYRYKQLFAEICNYKEIQDRAGNDAYKLVLCHYPIFRWNQMERGTILLYGHTHDGIEDTLFQRTIHNTEDNACSRHIKGQEARAYNVGCMKPYMNYTPRCLKDIIDG
ncbi:MAG: metallophosphoesterase [Butyrivibrio sp.]|nr:metallophosphoesterase [Muribaculum sp.]MCM1551124.1 metallophosphoesterase [Butyrivibrio sp.]